MREQPAVVYPASGVDAEVVRADMESASPVHQSLRAAGMLLPEELPARKAAQLGSAGKARCLPPCGLGNQALL